MPTVYNVPAEDLINEVAEELKKSKNITPPEWASFVKTASFKQHAPKNPEWWFVRCASLLRKVYVSGPVGTAHLKGRNRPEKFSKASGAIIRKALKQLEQEGYVTSDRRGRSISTKGRSMMDKVAAKIVKEKYPELKKY